jgi:hypothetical protein
MFIIQIFFLIASYAGTPDLLFREDWKETAAEIPLSQSHVSNPDLELTLHGPGMHGIKKSHHDTIENDPFYVWSGASPGNWAVSFKYRPGLIDLSGSAKVRWRSKQSGFRRLRLIVELNDGSWLVSDAFDGASPDWRVFEFTISDLTWHQLDILRISEKKPVKSPDLRRVKQVGFTDLMPGGVSDACSRLDWIEVYAEAQ